MIVYVYEHVWFALTHPYLLELYVGTCVCWSVSIIVFHSKCKHRTLPKRPATFNCSIYEQLMARNRPNTEGRVPNVYSDYIWWLIYACDLLSIFVRSDDDGPLYLAGDWRHRVVSPYLEKRRILMSTIAKRSNFISLRRCCWAEMTSSYCVAIRHALAKIDTY